MLKLLYYAVNLTGTAACCLFWIEFSVPLLNWVWLVSMLVAGFALEKQASREVASRLDRAASGLHAILCGIIASYTITWPLLMWVTSGGFPVSRPLYSPIISLLGLGPFLLGSLIWARRFASLPARILAGGAWVLILLPSSVRIGLFALGTAMTWGDDLEESEPVATADGAWTARHEYRMGGGVFADSYGGIWIEPRLLPLRQQVYRFACDGPLPEFRWNADNTLEVSRPEDGFGEVVGIPRLF